MSCSLRAAGRQPHRGPHRAQWARVEKESSIGHVPGRPRPFDGNCLSFTVAPRVCEARVVTHHLGLAALVIAASFGAALLSAVAGFGGGVLLLPVFVAVFGPRDAV